MKPILLIDFGSTYTKLTAVDLDGGCLLGTASALTTVEAGLSHGLARALDALFIKTGHLVFTHRLACSSAAGGLKMVAIGLVPELTVEAAKMAALGAGARLLAAYGYGMTPDEAEDLVASKPDLILLAGGTDGGNEEVIRANAALLAASPLAAPIIVAGNKNAAADVAAMLRAAGKEASAAANVLPELGRINIEPARDEIRRLFLERIIRAKGLDEVSKEIDGFLMPTPAAALRAATLLAEGSGGQPGWGELLLIDIGGATTDVHSLARGAPGRAEVAWKGLPEPFAKRTVEGDLGMRYSVAALVEACGLPAVSARAGLAPERVLTGIKARIEHVDFLPDTEEETKIEAALAYEAIAMAVRRHAGVLETHYTPFGAAYILRGKDLTPIKRVIGTGGVLLANPRPAELLAGAAFSAVEPESMRPMAPEYYLDRDYILPAMGLLAELAPETAYELMDACVVKVG